MIDAFEVWLPRHEPGHVFGITHPAVSPSVTLMDDAARNYAFPTGFDVAELNGYYSWPG